MIISGAASVSLALLIANFADHVPCAALGDSTAHGTYDMLFTFPVTARYRGLRHSVTLFVRVDHRCLGENFIGMLICQVYHHR